MALRTHSQLLSEPNAAGHWIRLAESLLQEGKLSAAIRAYRTGLAIRPDHAGIRHRLSQALLLEGEVQEGFALYEDRPWRPWFWPLEDQFGEANIKADKLILVSEQGLGDTLHFLRYAELLQQNGHTVVLLCQPQLVGLLQNMSAVKRVIGFWDPTVPTTPDQQMAENWTLVTEQLGNLEGWGWAPLMSVPSLLQHSQHLPLQHGLQLDACHQQTVVAWHKRLGCKPQHRLIGLTWQGNTAVEQLPEMQGRSMPFESWLELLPALNTCPPVEFVILQKGEEFSKAAAQLPLVQGQANYTPVHDFLETAAVVGCCDLVISCDTVIAHLAGNLQIPCCLALKKIPDWRWGLKSSTSTLYPSLRLFRQQQNGNWRDVVTAIGEALCQWNH